MAVKICISTLLSFSGAPTITRELSPEGGGRGCESQTSGWRCLAPLHLLLFTVSVTAAAGADALNVMCVRGVARARHIRYTENDRGSKDKEEKWS